MCCFASTRTYQSHRIMALAAGMTYYSILAIFPAIAALVAIYGLFADPSAIARHLDQLNGFLPGGAIDIARDQLTRVASKGSQTLGLTFLVGLAVSLWSANAAMKALFDTLNIVYGEDETRGFVKLNALSMSFTIGGVVFVVAALGSIVVIPVILDYAGLTDASDLLLRIGRWPAMYVVIAFALSVIYRFGPSRETVKWQSDHVGQRHCRPALAGTLGTVLLVCYQFRQVQRNLWLAGSDHRLHDMALAFRHRDFARRGNRCGIGASDRPRHHHRLVEAPWRARSGDGRYRGRSARRMKSSNSITLVPRLP